MSAYFTNSLTPPARLGLLASPCGSTLLRSGSAWLGRSQKDGLPGLPRGSIVRFKAINSRTGEWAAWSLPLLIEGGNGRQDTRPCFAHRRWSLTREVPMRKSWLLIIALVTLGFLAGTAGAGTVQVSGKHGVGEIAATCARVGG